MALHVLPLRGGEFANHSIRVQLEEQRYELVFRWNQRSSAWFLTILDDEGAVILGSRRVLPGFPLVAYYAYLPALQFGELLPVDTATEGIEPGLTELGGRVKVVYVDEGGVEE